MKRERPRRRRRRKPRGQKAFLNVLKEGGVPKDADLLGKGLEQATMKELYDAGEEARRREVPWSGMPEGERTKAAEEFSRLHRAIEHRSLRAAVPRELALIGDAHRTEDDPAVHAPIPPVPSAEMALLNEEQRGILLSLTLYTSFRRFMQKARLTGIWDELRFGDMGHRLSESAGLELHLFRRLDDRTFVAAFRMDGSGRYYVALAFHPAKAEGRDNLLGGTSPFSTYFFTCTCQ